MMLSDHVRGIPPGRPAWLDDAGGGRYADLVDIPLRLPHPVPHPRIALRLRSVASAIRALCALDGRVQALLLLSPSLDDATCARLAERARCTWVISDVDHGSASGMVPVLDWETLADLPAMDTTPARTEWILCTSGTTAEPKLVRHSLGSLMRTAKVDPQRSADVRWGLLYDYTRFAGLQVLLQSLLSGATLLAPALDHSIETRVRYLVAHGCTHLAGTPTLWRTLMMTAGFDQLKLRQITLGGEIADERLLRMLRDRMPGAGIRHIYASTEAGVCFSVNDGRAGFPKAYLDDAQVGDQLRIVEGRLHVKRDGEAATYLDEAYALRRVDGFIDTGDLVEVSGDRVLFRGRASGIINVGGSKVHPEMVEQVLMEHVGVALARVYARANPIAGALVVADIVAAPGFEDAAALSLLLQRHCQARLERYQRPVTMRIVDWIGATDAGKMSRV